FGSVTGSHPRARRPPSTRPPAPRPADPPRLSYPLPRVRAMARVKSVYRCTECGAEAPKWTGWCSGCEASGSLVEELSTPPARPGSFVALNRASVPIPIAEAVGDAPRPVPTGDAELDRVLGGGLVPGSVTVLGGEPGVGKSTLLLQALA